MKKTSASTARFITLLVIAGFSQTVALHADVEYTPGNLFYYTSAQSAAVNSTQAPYASFTAPESTAANSISINLNGVDSLSSLTYGLQLDDGTGKPTGVFVASGTVAPVLGWNTVAFGDYNLVAGQVYHVVLQSVPSGSATWRILAGATQNIHSYGVIDTNFARGAFSKGVWSNPTKDWSAVYRVGTTGNVPIGNVYTAGNSTNLANAASIPAQRFVYHALDTGNFLDSVTVRLNVAATGPANDITLVLLDSSNNPLETKVLSADLLTVNSTNNYTINFSKALELVDGESYSLALHSVGSAGNSVKWSYAYTDNSEELYSATFQGTDGYGFSYKNTDFLAANAAQYSLDYIFSYTTDAIPEPGTYAFALAGAGLIGLSLRRRARADR
jgi:hypothetical protein